MAEYYLDVDYSDLTLTGTLTFTNGSSTVTGSGTAFTTELAVSDYIKSTDATYGGTWYKVTGITDDVTVTINTAFKETTHFATAVRNRGDGSLTSPFCHLTQYTQDTVRSSGDILYIQNGQVLRCTTIINFDENGTPENYIEITSSDYKNINNTNKPIIDFLGLANYLNFSYKSYIKIKSLELYNFAPSYKGALYYYYGNFNIAEDIYIHHGTSNYSYGISVDYSEVILKDIIVDDIINYKMNIGIGSIKAKNIQFLDSTTVGTKGLICRGGIVRIVNSDLGNHDIKLNNRPAVEVYLDNVVNYTVTSYYPTTYSSVKDLITNKTSNTLFDISKDDAVAVNGTTPSVKFVGYANIDRNFTATLAEWVLDSVVAGTYTVTVNARSSGLTTFPTEDQLFVEVMYFDDALSEHLAFAKSTDVITSNDVDTALNVTFTSAKDGKVVIRVKCGFITGTSGAIYIENGFSIS